MNTQTIDDSDFGAPAELGRLDSVAGQIVVSTATAEMIPQLAQLLADDEIAQTREDVTDLRAYRRAFDAIDASPEQHLFVGLIDVQPVAMLQVSLIPTLSRSGTLRAQLEGVRVAEPLRGTGVGTALLQWAIEFARESGAGLVQLTTDRTREEALHFYQRLGFTDSHLGLKLVFE